MLSKLEPKLLGEMSPGELIRFKYRRKMLLGVAAKCEFLRIASCLIVVMLEDVPEQPGTATACIPIHDYLAAETGLSYGKALGFEVLPTAQVVSKNDERFATNGALLIGRGLRGLRSLFLGDSLNESPIVIDIDDWAAVSNSFDKPALFAVLEWELRQLSDSRLDPPFPPLYTFKANS